MRGMDDMTDINETVKYTRPTENAQVKDILVQVYTALEEKGYDPVNQIVGYIMSGDPTYITGHNNARSLIQKVERDELVEELLPEYIAKNNWNKLV